MHGRAERDESDVGGTMPDKDIKAEREKRVKERDKAKKRGA